MTFLLEPALTALRRLAQENESTARHTGGGQPWAAVRTLPRPGGTA